jgi:predicted GNAT family N-acyltransferase
LDIVILIKTWQEAEQEAYFVRKQVFIEEQGVPVNMELDEFDSTAKHALAYVNSDCVGTARLIAFPGKVGRIGRMAVLQTYRRQGIGGNLLNALLESCKSQGMAQLELHAQLSAMSFYEQFGFIARGEMYYEAGIAHRDMILSI